MIKTLFTSFLLLALGVVSALAADETQTGKIIAIDGNQVQIEVAGELPAWAKKGGYLRATLPDGKLLLRGAKITAVEGQVMTITTTKAKEMTVGTGLALAKGKASAAC